MKRIILVLIAALVAAPACAGDKAAKQTIAYLQKLRTGSGGYLPRDPKGNAKIVPTLRATVSAIRALKHLGVEPANKAAAAKFIASCYDAKAGGFSDTPKGGVDVTSTAIGMMGIAQLGAPLDKYTDSAAEYLSDNAQTFEEIRIAAAGFEAIEQKAPKANQWVVEVFKMQNKDGTFGEAPGQARATGSCVVTILRLGRRPPVPGVYLMTFKAGQHQNGGWGKADDEAASGLETTYRVMRCYHMMKATPPDVEGVRSFVAKCRNADGGYGVAPGEGSTVSGAYFAATVLHWLDE